MVDSNTLAGTPSPTPEDSPSPSTECDSLKEGESPASTPETPSQRDEDTPVGVELPPLEEDASEEDGTPLSQAFRVSLVNSLRNVSSAIDSVRDMASSNRISSGMASHLEREALKYTASNICDMVVKEIEETRK